MGRGGTEWCVCWCVSVVYTPNAVISNLPTCQKCHTCVAHTYGVGGLCTRMSPLTCMCVCVCMVNTLWLESTKSTCISFHRLVNNHLWIRNYLSLFSHFADAEYSHTHTHIRSSKHMPAQSMCRNTWWVQTACQHLTASASNQDSDAEFRPPTACIQSPSYNNSTHPYTHTQTHSRHTFEH